jgi:preprotein translocase subunit SecE
MFNKIAQYFNSVVLEIKKVSWLTKDELISSTIIVGVFSIIVGIFLFVVDNGLSALMSRFLIK